MFGSGLLSEQPVRYMQSQGLGIFDEQSIAAKGGSGLSLTLHLSEGMRY